MTYPKSGEGFDNHWTVDGPERWPGLRAECERYADTFIKGRSPAEWPAAFFAFAGYVVGKMEEEQEAKNMSRLVMRAAFRKWASVARVRVATNDDAALLRTGEEIGWLP
jgi:hypothetical protein